MKAKRFSNFPLGVIGASILALFVVVGIYAPLFASSKPFVVNFNGAWYFPWFRSLFYSGFYTKPVDLFFNLLMFTFPLMVLFKKHFKWMLLLQAALFLALLYFPPADPKGDINLAFERQKKIQAGAKSDFAFELAHMNPYARMNLAVDMLRKKRHHERIEGFIEKGFYPYTPYNIQLEQDRIDPDYFKDKKTWLKEQNISFILWPLLREFHWQDDAGGDQKLNQRVPWYELTRVNRKDLVASLLFGIRISLMVGVLAIAIALLIGVPLGGLSGYFGGRTDLAISRFVEIWEAMPAFFMLLLVVAILESKSVFIVISIIGVFGWTTFARYTRGEFFKERSLPYVEACQVMGFSRFYTMLHHILPNAIPPLLTLLPFAILGAITSEAALSFLGLGEENSSSWGVLMDEGRQAFPGESYLLWPPAFLLTLLLVSIALVGDALRDYLDPKDAT